MSDHLNLQITLHSFKDLKPNPWNPNSVGVENMEKLKASVKNNGFFKPVLVRELKDGSLQILGGQHRAEVAAELEMDIPVINLGSMSDSKAKKITLIDNDGYGENDSMKLSKVLRDLIESGENIIQEMTYQQEELDQLLDMSVEIDLDDLGDLDDLSDDPDYNESINQGDVSTHLFKTLKFKVSFDEAETIEAKLDKIIENLGVEDTDQSVLRGYALIEAMNS